MTVCPQWLQIDVALRRTTDQARLHARAVLITLRPYIEQWRATRSLTWFYFTRKPPDLRLRFAGPNPNFDLTQPIWAVLARLVEEGHIDHHDLGFYEPETRKFGGPQAMDLVHALFDSDTTAWLALEELRATGDAALSEAQIAALLVHDLFQRVLPDDTERWDAWMNLADLLPAPAAGSVVPPPPTHATRPERDVLAARVKATAAFAAGLTRLTQIGRLQVGPRAMLPHVAMAILHRNGLTGLQQATIALAAATALNPHPGTERG
jgi:thiopeptide-type bacteriocin biosynthesis protein